MGADDADRNGASKSATRIVTINSERLVLSILFIGLQSKYVAQTSVCVVLELNPKTTKHRLKSVPRA